MVKHSDIARKRFVSFLAKVRIAGRYIYRIGFSPRHVILHGHDREKLPLLAIQMFQDLIISRLIAVIPTYIITFQAFGTIVNKGIKSQILVNDISGIIARGGQMDYCPILR